MKITNKIKIRKEHILPLLLFSWLSTEMILTVTRFLLTKFGFSEGVFRELILFFVSLLPFFALFFFSKFIPIRKFYSFFTLYLIVILSFIITYMNNPELDYFYMRDDYGIGRIFKPECAIYAFLFFSIIKSPKDTLKTLYKFAYINYIFLFVFQLLPRLFRGYWIDVDYIGHEVHRLYSLSYGYSMLVPVIILLYFFIKRKKLIDLVFITIGLLSIFSQGSRGALLIPIIFVGLMIISNILEKQNIHKKIEKIILLVISFLALACLFPYILDLFIKIFENLGIHSRTLEMLVNNSISDDSGRSIIWDAVIKAIQNGGCLGYGVFGDRPFVYPIHYVAYSHNIVLELIVSFGLIGIVICSVLVFIIIRMLFFCKNQYWRELFIIFLSLSCQLFLSMSFWYLMEFWAMLGIFVAYNNNK